MCTSCAVTSVATELGKNVMKSQGSPLWTVYLAMSLHATGSSIPKTLYSPMDEHIYRHCHTLSATGAGSPSDLNSWPLTLLWLTPWWSECTLTCGSCPLPSDTAVDSKHNTQSTAENSIHYCMYTTIAIGKCLRRLLLLHCSLSFSIACVLVYIVRCTDKTSLTTPFLWHVCTYTVAICAIPYLAIPQFCILSFKDALCQHHLLCNS